MKGVRLFALVSSIALILVLVLSGCGNGDGGNGGSTEDKEYRALNPTGIFIPVETSGLAERLDTIEGKTIYVCQGEADPVIMPALIIALRNEYTGTTWIYYDRSDFGPSRPGTGGAATSTNQPEDPDILDKVDAVIRGNGW